MSDSADYVNTVFNSRTEDVAAMLEAENKGEEYEGWDATEAIYELPLSIQKKTLVTITLGVGGPGDWIDAVCSTDYATPQIESATYTAVWGSDRKVTILSPGDALWTLAERFVESMESE